MAVVGGSVTNLKTDFIGIPPEHMLLTGMAIGWRNTDHPINGLRFGRAAVESFTNFHGSQTASAMIKSRPWRQQAP